MRIEENYFIDVDLTDNEKTSVVTVYRQRGSAVRMVNSFTGKDAELIFQILNGDRRLNETS